MSLRIVGEYRPPRELVAVSAARVAGRGFLVVGEQGIEVDGEIVDSPGPIAFWKMGLPFLLAMVAAVAFLDQPNRVVGPLVVVVMLLWFWSRFRSEYGRRGTFSVTWADVEHVVRLPSDPEVVGFVLARPLGNPGTPEHLFFAPTMGIDALVDALRTYGPASLPIDLESADRPLDPALQPAD